LKEYCRGDRAPKELKTKKRRRDNQAGKKVRRHHDKIEKRHNQGREKGITSGSGSWGGGRVVYGGGENAQLSVGEEKF